MKNYTQSRNSAGSVLLSGTQPQLPGSLGWGGCTLADKYLLLFPCTVHPVLKKGTERAFDVSSFCGSARSGVLLVVLEWTNPLGKILKRPVCRAGL